jgi:hypothetical protein
MKSSKDHLPFSDTIYQIKHVEKYHNSNEGLVLLKRIAVLVAPSMRSRGWKVKLLTEFIPTNASLHGLNVNRGHTIKVRLRSPEK